MGYKKKGYYDNKKIPKGLAVASNESGDFLYMKNKKEAIRFMKAYTKKYGVFDGGKKKKK